MVNYRNSKITEIAEWVAIVRTELATISSFKIF